MIDAPTATRRARWWHYPRRRKKVLIGLLAAGLFGAALLVGAWSRVCGGGACPSIAGLSNYDPDQASKLYAADGRLITDYGNQRRTVVPLQQMSPAVTAAFLAVEDRRFYHHHGIDWVRVLGSIKSTVFGNKQGFSTITMQLAGNLWPEQIDRSQREGLAGLTRKLREARMALEIERNYSKDKILELYLNQINLGNGAYGVEAAAQRYFGKSARNVNVAEAATLAALAKAPGRYNPRRSPRLAVQRRNLIIGLMEDWGKLAHQSAEAWKAYPLSLSSRSDYTGVAEYFVEYVRQILQARFGADLYRAGFRIYTTLDLDMQLAAERALEAQLTSIEENTGGLGPYHHLTYRQYLDQRSETTPETDNGPFTPYLQGVMVSLEAKTGNIRAMVGGRDFEDSKFNRATQALRQAGSTFKPFVYAAAIRAGIPWSKIFDDSPVSVEIPDQPTWEPKNYDSKFQGMMSMRKALYESRNTVAVKVGLELGEDAVIAEASNFGLSTRIPRVPSIFIGSADVVPLELISAYTGFANLGSVTTPVAILRVEDRQGHIVWQPETQQRQVMDPQHAWLVLDGLRDVIRRGTAAGAIVGRGGFTLPAGGKTGTTNDGMDVWFIGFTNDLVTGVWMGFDKKTVIKSNAQGGLLAAPAWAAMMREVYERRRTPPPWLMPDGLLDLEIDEGTGYLSTPFCPPDQVRHEYYIPGTEPTERCPLHSPFRGGGRGGAH
ncbi:MAG TPA: PBP1A family penicillin-binding protein [Gemmatimonadales bacterium]|nr:PBP1A family penicillin-binding protein [Gemmatimonadales bacterium]